MTVKKALQKRIRITSQGKIKRKAIGGSHLRTKKQTNQKKRTRKIKVSATSDVPWNKMIA